MNSWPSWRTARCVQCLSLQGCLSEARLAVAAGVVLAVGLSLGFVLGRRDSAGPAPAQLPPQVSMRVADLAGTVLVRHDGAEVWHTLTPDATIHVGDTFHAAAQARLTLAVANQSTIQVDQNSMLILLESYNGETQFYLEHGQCTASLESPHGPFFISTPHGRVEAWEPSSLSKSSSRPQRLS